MPRFRDLNLDRCRVGGMAVEVRSPVFLSLSARKMAPPAHRLQAECRMGCAAKAFRMDALRWDERFYLLAPPALGRHAARNARPGMCRPFQFLGLTDSCETLGPSTCTGLAEKPPPGGLNASWCMHI
jgi:hypothetical protein